MSDITYTRITPAGEEKCSLLDGEGMTREEKNEAIIRFCEEDNRDCGDCIISEPCAKCLGAFDRQPDRCNEAYDILVNAEVIKPPVNFVKANPDDEIESESDAVESADGKIRTPIARLIIGGSAEKPCYSIQYFDPSDKEFHIGFSSYALNYVQEWFEAYFDIVNEPTCIPYIKPENIAVQNDEEVASDAVNHPNHYTQNGIECIAAIRASMTSDGFMDYCKGNVIKYIWRWRDKGGVEDLHKARVYLDWLIEEASE